MNRSFRLLGRLVWKTADLRIARLAILLPLIVGFVGAAGATPSGSDGNAVPLEVVLRDVREDILNASVTLRRYQFFQRTTKRDRDRNGEVKNTTERLYRVSPEPDGALHYRLIAEDGVAKSSSELARQDRRDQARRRSTQRQRQQESPRDRAARQADEAQERRKYREMVEEVFRLYDFRLQGRRRLNGRDTLHVTFAARPGVRVRTRVGKLLSRTRGRAWLSEGDHQVVHIEFEAIDDVAYGWFGAMAKLFRGARAEFTQEPSADGTWLPAEYWMSATARLFFVKRSVIDRTVEFYGYERVDQPASSASHVSR